MKRVIALFLLTAVLITFVNTASAHTVNDKLQVYKAAYKPVIDGEMDPIWQCASTERVVVMDQNDVAEPDDYLDLFPTMRVLWDDTNLYIFINIIDETINTDNVESYLNDSIELYFDADNSKTETFDGVDDIQIRVEYSDLSTDDIDTGFGSGGSDWGYDKSGIEFVVMDWARDAGDATGWNLEIALPLADLQIDPNLPFGFDVQCNDNDTGERENMFRFWACDNDEWKNASLFGTAEFSDYVADEILNVLKTSVAPVIDGQIDEIWESYAPSIYQGKYVVRDGGVAPAKYTEMEVWQDLQFNFSALWDDDMIYFLGIVIDDEINTENTSSYQNDSFEFFFDADNSKLDEYDGVDDIQFRIEYSDSVNDDIDMSYGSGGNDWGFAIPTVQFAKSDLDMGDLTGWVIEIAFPIAELQLMYDSPFGFEMQYNDNDEGTRKNIARWWGDDDDSWKMPSFYGTCVLTDAGGTAVEKQELSVASTFKLCQNYPNPFNPSTNINFTVDSRKHVKLMVYDVLGNQVAQLINEDKQAGQYMVEFDGSQLASGIYFYKLEAGNQIVTKKMMLVK